MIINKIGSNYSVNTNYNHTAIKKQNNNSQPQYSSNSISNVFPKSYVNFTGGVESVENKKMQEIISLATPEAKELLEQSKDIAKQAGYDEVNENHIFLASIRKNLEFLNGVEEGTIGQEEPLPEASSTFIQLMGEDLYDDSYKQPIMKEFLSNKEAELTEVIKEKSPNKTVKEVKYNKEVADTLYSVYDSLKAQYAGKKIALPADFMTSALSSALKRDNNSNIIADSLKELIDFAQEEINKAGQKPMSDIHLSAYDDKAKKVLKNLSLGVNMFVLSDKGMNPDYMINSISHVLETSEDEKGKLNNENSKFTYIENVDSKKLLSAINELSQEDKIQIIAFNFDDWWANNAKVDKSGMSTWNPGVQLHDLILNPPKNIKFIAIQDKEAYYDIMQDPYMASLFKNFGDTSIPMLSPAQTKEAFREQPQLMEGIEKSFTPEALDKTIEAAALLDGAYPEKAQNLMSKLSAYYVEKEEINVDDVNSYMEEAKNLFKAASNDGKVQVLFDTGIGLNQILGKDATKNEAAAIVKEIKNQTLGSKSMIVYSADDSIGSGRRYTAKAIAGEAKVPYAEVNAMDFAITSDLATGATIYPDNEIKQIFSMLRAQAEANPNKAAVLYVENSEYFMAGEEISPRYTTLMPLIQREIKAANDKGLNILLLASVNNSKIANSQLAQSFGIIDSLCVETPAYNFGAREKIIDNELTKMNLNIAGDAGKRQEFIKFASEITEYFSFSDLDALLKKTRSVAVEREHKEITQEDLVEGFMRLTTGRPAPAEMAKYEKELVTAHECGHATNLEVMKNLAVEEQIPWHSAERVNFITLDPRGSYGGAVYHSSRVENAEESFEKAFSNIVCSYGGHSAEKKFYNMDGSWGISSDLEHVTSTAQKMAMIMGQGSVKQSVGGMIDISPEKREKMEHDVDAFTQNALIASDLITDAYSDFNKEFTAKYSPLVGTGACLILGSTFREELKNWIAKQPVAKRAELKELNNTLREIINSAKKGIKYVVEDKFSVSSWYKTL